MKSLRVYNLTTTRTGSITVESAIVIPVCLLIVCGLILFGAAYKDKIIGLAYDGLIVDETIIKGDMSLNQNGMAFLENEKWVVRVGDVVHDFVEQFTYTRDIKNKLDEKVTSLQDKMKKTN